MSVVHSVFLAFLDCVFRYRRVSRRVILANVAAFVLVALMIVGLFGVAQIGIVLHSLRTLAGDITLSLNTTRELRTTLFDFRKDLLYTVINQVTMSDQRIDAFQSAVSDLTSVYKTGAFTAKEAGLVDQIVGAQQEINIELKRLRDAPGDPVTLLRVDQSTEPLGKILLEAGRINTLRLQGLSSDLEEQLKAGLFVTSVLGGILLGFGLLGLSLLLLYSLLDRIEKSAARP